MDFWAAYISEMDGSNRWMLSEGDLMLSAPIWSPGKQWLIVTVSEWYSQDLVAALIHLPDCQIIPLPHLKGEIKSWAP